MHNLQHLLAGLVRPGVLVVSDELSVLVGGQPPSARRGGRTRWTRSSQGAP